ncbi:MAG: hypothetical protein Q8Q54_12295 [Methylococcales bacterium]|nr:hypothetical protein [Methylococcales bacterium]MDP3839689.1 hypothetical protein [Methylococcales bacterium]
MFKKIPLLMLFSLVAVLPAVADEFSLLNEEKLGDFKMGLSETDLKKKVSCPLKREEEQLWGADGIYHQVWHYPACGLSFSMSSVQKSGSKSVDGITVTAPSVLKTKRGIHIGSSQQAVMKAYGHDKAADAESNKQMFVAGSIYGGLVFTFKQHKVTSIFLGAGAE